MKNLPPPRVIKTAIIKMDSSIVSKEGIEKLLTMLPTEEEKTKILEAQMANPEVSLGSAEFFLLNLSSISEIKARLQLWLFKLDFETIEREIAEHLMDLKVGMGELKNSKTFREIIRVLREIGNYLNSCDLKGFQLDYLSRVPEVKDTVQKHSLLQHLCTVILEKCENTTDLYSDLGGISRCSKADWDDILRKINKLEHDGLSSWDNLRAIAKHDSSPLLRNKLSEFLIDCSERIQVLKMVHSRLMNRFKKFLYYLGYPEDTVRAYKVKDFCKLISEFALEYKTVRDRLLHQKEKRDNHVDRNKTRGKLITETGKFAQVNDVLTDNAKAEDHKMVNVILKNVPKPGPNGSGSTQNLAGASAGALPGQRTRSRQSNAVDSRNASVSSPNPQQTGVNGKASSMASNGFKLTDTEDDDAGQFDAILRSTLSSTSKNSLPKKKTRKYGERKSFRRTRNLNEENDDN